MAFTMWDFLLSSLMFTNSIAILSEERFLARSTCMLRWPVPGPFVLVGWGRVQSDAAGGFGGGEGPSVKKQIIHLLSAVRTLLRSTRRACRLALTL